DLECDGVPVDVNRLNSVRDSLAGEAARIKEAVIGRVGSCFNLDSDEEITAILKMDQVLAKVVGFRKVNGKLLEELAIAHETARLLVRYDRYQKRLRNIEAVMLSSLFRTVGCIPYLVKQGRTIADSHPSSQDCSIRSEERRVGK